MQCAGGTRSDRVYFGGSLAYQVLGLRLGNFCAGECMVQSPTPERRGNQKHRGNPMYGVLWVAEILHHSEARDVVRPSTPGLILGVTAGPMWRESHSVNPAPRAVHRSPWASGQEEHQY